MVIKLRHITLILALLLPSAIAAQPFTVKGQFGTGTGLGGNSDFRVFGGVGFPELTGENRGFRVRAGAVLQIPDLPLVSLVEGNGVPGQEVTIPVSVDDASGLAGGDFTVTFDSAILRPVRVEPSGLLPVEKFRVIPNFEIRGIARIAIAGPTALPEGKGPMFSIVFTIASSAQAGSYPLILRSSTIVNESGVPVVTAAEHGAVIVKTLVPGDINDDGAVTSAAAILALRFAIALQRPSANQLASADVNEDGQITIGDVILIFRRAAGLIQEFTKPAVLLAGSTEAEIQFSDLRPNEDGSVFLDIAVMRPAGTMGGDVHLSWDPLQATIEVFPLGMGKESISELIATEPGTVRFSFAEPPGTGSSGAMILGLHIRDAGDKPLPLSLTGEFYDTWGLPAAVIEMHRAVEASLPTEYALAQNYPNPFNPSTTIRYDLPESGRVSLTIYDVTGQEVRRLLTEHVNAGRQSVVWDGRDARGRNVASGIYIYRVDVDGGRFNAVKRMVFLK